MTAGDKQMGEQSQPDAGLIAARGSTDKDIGGVAYLCISMAQKSIIFCSCEPEHT